MAMPGQREWRTMDDQKAAWGAGPWRDEPDKIHWKDQATGLDCLIVRNRVGALCGYVGVPEGHPLFDVEYSKPHVHVHGGLTFANRCDPWPDDPEHARGICHPAEPGEPEVWWIGFDCAHGFDFAPADQDALRLTWEERDNTPPYRDVAYVQAEVTRLAAQVKDHGPVPDSQEDNE